MRTRPRTPSRTSTRTGTSRHPRRLASLLAAVVAATTLAAPTPADAGSPGAGGTAGTGPDRVGDAGSTGASRAGAGAAPADSGARREPAPYRIVWDDFRNGFQTGAPDARWFNVAIGPYVADDGVPTTSGRGLRVAAGGTNPRTGQPAFVRTIGQDPDNGLGLPGSFDHLKWLAFTTHQSSHGFPGFDAVPGQELSCETWMSARTYGTRGHPFGPAVDDPEADPRLALVAMNAVDPETNTIFDFVLTNDHIYALYERRPDARPQLGYYASFAHVVPLAPRSPGDTHHLAIAYDRSAGVVRWLLDDREVLRVDRIGHRLDRRYVAIDHGGVETTVEPRQLNCGMGMFTLLDAEMPGLDADALVRLTTHPDSPYFDPATGEPAPQRFVDEESLAGSRLFGQGAAFTMRRYVVASRAVG